MSLISQEIQKCSFPTAALAKPEIRLHTYTSDPITVVEQMAVEVKYKDYEGRHTLYIVEGNGLALVGRDWLCKIQLDWPSIRTVSCQESMQALEELLNKYSQIFQPGLGTISQMKAHLSLMSDAKPQFHRPRSVPFTIKEKVGKQLDRLEELGALRKVDHSEWAAPIVPVPKGDGSIRICGDYKVTVNPSLQIDQYPLPKPSDLMACLTEGQMFTHVSLQGIPFVICYLDDMLVTGHSPAEHLQNLEEVFQM